jgi:nucleoside-diphosphate-sugar epimerase
MKKKVIITGGSGFVGQALSRQLGKNGRWRVISVSRKMDYQNVFHVKDYSDTIGGDVLIHTAEPRDRGTVNQMPDEYISEAMRVTAALVAKPYKKIIYLSSSSVYGINAQIPFAEDHPVQACDAYSKMKLANEKQVLNTGGIVVRLSNIIGPGMAPNNVFSDILKQITNNGPVYLRNKWPVRDFIWIDDMVEAIGLLVAGGKPGIYNIGSGKGVSIEEVAKMALCLSGQSERTIHSGVEKAMQSINVIDPNKMKKMYNWSPKMTVIQCLEQLINHQKA